MGLFGFGKDDARDAKDQIAQTKSALEQAQEAPKDQGFIGSSCGRLGTTAMAVLTLQVYYRYPPPVWLAEPKK